MDPTSVKYKLFFNVNTKKNSTNKFFLAKDKKV